MAGREPPTDRISSRKRLPTVASNGSPASSKAVSYTHLRAHETVLDLVCRLLLEKKKEKEYTEFARYITNKP